MKKEWRSFCTYSLRELKCLWKCLAWPNFFLGKQSQSKFPVSTLSITCKNNQLMITCHILLLRPVLEHSYWINEVARNLWLIFFWHCREWVHLHDKFLGSWQMTPCPFYHRLSQAFYTSPLLIKLNESGQRRMKSNFDETFLRVKTSSGTLMHWWDSI